MKKNIMMRLASTTAVMVMLTTCIVSGTYAKYTTSTDSSDSARVAKWGFDSTTTFDITDLFKSTYGNTVDGDGDDVIAPGTYGSADFKFAPVGNAAPEVAYSISVDASDSSIDASIAANPNILWALDASDVADPEDGAYGTFADMLTAINELSETDIAPNTLPSDFDANETHTISWIWVFSTEEAIDVMDTNMGNIAANGTDLKVDVKISISATQVD